MAQKLSDLFEAARSPVVEWQGKLVYGMYELPGMSEDEDLRIEFSDPSPARPQALCLGVRGGRLEINNQLLSEIALWSDSAPRVVVARARPRRGKVVTVRLWNAWRDLDDPVDRMDAWIGNAGMLIEGDVTSGLVLRCSDGYDEPTFDDLVATVTFRETHPSEPDLG